MEVSQVLERRPRAAERKLVTISTQLMDARSVIVTGDFTRWSEEGIPLHSDPDGLWEVSLILYPGEYQYRLRVDGEWVDHPEATLRVPNSFGTENCVLVVAP